MDAAAVRRPRPPRTERGTVMLDALVSIVVTSLAMLASASLAVNAAKVNQTGRYRAQAVLLINDIAERIGANPAAAATGAYAYTPGAGGDQDLETPPNDCGAESCSPAQHALAELITWRNAVQAGLPQATVGIAYTAAVGATPGRYAITLNWVERTVGHGGAARTVQNNATTETFAYNATVVLPPR
jgi:type IV pilus assembly protein PilV